MHSILDTVVYGTVGCLILGLATWAVNRGGAGKERDGAIVYKPRPGTVVIFAVVTGLGLFVWGASVLAILAADWQQSLFEFVVGLPFIWMGLFGILQTLTLNAEGIRYQRWYLQPIAIAWSDLDHYEIAKSAYTSVLVLRPRLMETAEKARSIALSGYAYNLKDLLGRITQTKPVRQLPLRRQSWYRY